MTSFKSLLLLIVVLAFAATSVRAGDFATLNFIGFSKDGRYLAFEEYGTQDGSGFPYSSIYFIDVAKNSFAAPSVNVRLDNEQATEQQARARAKAAASRSLTRLRIVAGNTGQLTVARMLTDLSVNEFREGKTQKLNFAEIVGSMYRRGDYELILNLSEVKTKACEYLEPDPAFKFELSLKDKEADKTVILQKDSALPPSRACPINYTMQYVYLYEDKIAAFLNTYFMGFEGPDMRYLVVTGKFK